MAASSSCPHADSRKLVWDFSSSNIVHSCDGGLYLRTAPQSSSGDWFSLSGNLSVAELHSIAYDPKVRAHDRELHCSLE